MNFSFKILFYFIISFFLSCKNENSNDQLFKIITKDSIVDKNISIYKYGVYINLPKDTLGISKKTIDYLKTIEANHKDNESIHLWIFTDSTIIPNSFYADWPTKEIKSKCFAHAAKYHKEYYRYHYNLLGEFKKE